MVVGSVNRGGPTVKVGETSHVAPPDLVGAGAGADGTGSPGRGGRRRLAPLDGIRAFAVMAVLLYHGGVAGVDGGLLGVDVFFVLSGFLITSLLCGEYLARGTIRLGHFWAGRARRLLPGLFLLLLGVALYAWVFRNTLDVSSIRGDALATILYVANWHFVFSGQGYFTQSTTPSPLLPMWSLGVEEQYYLIWPLVTLFILRRGGTRWVAWVAGVAAGASALLMASMYLAGSSIDRLYYGTDTRVQALLVGSVLGAIASHRQWRVIAVSWARTRVGRLTGIVLGATGAGVLLWVWHAFNGQGAFLYQGGFLVVALAAGAVVTAVTSWRTSLLAAVLSLRPLTYIGRISYGLYLYHWPLFLALDHDHTGLSGSALLTVRLAATFVAAALSFHYIEDPIRRGQFAQTWRGLVFALGGAVATAAVVVAATAPVVLASDPAPLVAGSSGVSASQRQALSSAHAFTSHPVRFMVFGDSVAYTAVIGLTKDSIRHYGVKVYPEAALGCDLDLAPSRLGGVVYQGQPGVNCGSWQSDWRHDVRQVHPEVAGLLIGRFELADHVYGGSWVHVGQPRWDRHLSLELDQAVTILSAGGARVALFTFPYIDPPLEQPNGSIYPENDPARVNDWNRLVRQVAARHGKSVTLIDLNRMLDPNGHYAMTVDRVAMRWPDDGIHISTAGGEWLQPRLLPELGQLGLQVRLAGR
jgi:peptidoglycan/LPS O-acetylase OafA/YrhL